MKKITLLLLLLVTFTSFSQDGLWLRRDAAILPKKLTETGDAHKIASYFSTKKLEALEPVLKISEQQKLELDSLFQTQYKPLNDIAVKHKEAKTTQNKLELIKVLIQQEEEFRKLLTEEQRIYYLSYDPRKGLSDNYLFTSRFFTEKELMEYKKELL